MPVYADRSEHRLNQGDLLGGLSFPVDPTEGRAQTGMVISNDCDCDKFLAPTTPLAESERERWRITVAIVHPVDWLTGGRPRAVRDDAMPRYLHLPPEDDVPELCVDLWTEQPVLMTDALDAERLASASTETRNRLWWKIIRLRLGEHYKAILEGAIPPDAA